MRRRPGLGLGLGLGPVPRIMAWAAKRVPGACLGPPGLPGGLQLRLGPPLRPVRLAQGRRRPRVADLVMLARALAADNAAALADRVRIAPDPSERP